MSQATDTPIQTDVVDGEIQDAVVDTAPEKMSRESIMDSIVAKRMEEIDADISMEPEAEDVLEVTPSLSEETEVQKEPETIPVKVDGVVADVTPQEIREYQINKAADLRMREADAESKRLAEREADLQRREAELEISAAQNQSTQADPEDAKTLAKKLVQSTFDEDEDGAAEVIQEIMAGKQRVAAAPTAVSQDDINAGIEQVLYRREQKKAIDRFDKDYPFLATNMRDAVNERSKVEAAEDPSATTWELIDRSAKFIQSKIESEFAVKKEVVTDLDARRKQKASAGNAVKAGVNAKATLPSKDAAPPQTTHQSFAEIQRARGQG